jgi:hypothetical protein
VKVPPCKFNLGLVVGGDKNHFLAVNYRHNLHGTDGDKHTRFTAEIQQQAHRVVVSGGQGAGFRPKGIAAIKTFVLWHDLPPLPELILKQEKCECQ